MTRTSDEIRAETLKELNVTVNGEAAKREATSGQSGQRCKPRPFASFADHERFRDLSGTAVKVWLRMFRHARRGKVEIGVEQLAEEIGRGARQTKAAIHELSRAGFVQRVKRGRRGKGVSTYTIHSLPRCGKPHPIETEQGAESRTLRPRITCGKPPVPRCGKPPVSSITSAAPAASAAGGSAEGCAE